MLEILQDSIDFTHVWVLFSPWISTSEKGFGIADCLLLQFLSVTQKERCVCVCVCVCVCICVSVREERGGWEILEVMQRQAWWEMV
jgi:hypothetical protein